MNVHHMHPKVSGADLTSGAPHLKPPIDRAPPLGVFKVRKLNAEAAFRRPSSVIEEAEGYLNQVYFRDRAFDEAADAGFEVNTPPRPEECFELDVDTNTRRPMTRDEMMEQARLDFGGSGAAWLQRVLAFDRWQLDCFEEEVRHEFPQHEGRVKSTAQYATDAAWRVLDRPAVTLREVAVKLGIWLAEIGQFELQEEDAKPLRRLCGEFLALASTPDVST